jgi:hypothetical protein
VKRVWAILRFFTQFGFIVFTYLPCDIAIIMCDPEWKIKTSVEILVFIHRPHEDFSDLLGRWRQSQVYLGTQI